MTFGISYHPMDCSFLVKDLRLQEKAQMLQTMLGLYGAI